MSRIVHGGRIDAAIAKHGGTRAKWLDLSTGINAKGWPVPELEASIWRELPDEGLADTCRAAARKAYGVHEVAHVSLAPGSQMHIQVLPRLFKPQPVAVVGFTYQEHGVCWQQAGHEVYVTDGLESAEATARIVIVVNPNNPDGRIIGRSGLVALARRLGAKGGLLVVDEAFGDVTPNASVVPEAGRDGMVVMRSLGKFYGLAGARLGMAFCAPMLGERLDSALGPWAVSGPALEIGTKALLDEKWRARTRKALSAGREALEEVLLNAKLEVVGGTDLFVLARHEKADAVAEALAAKHIAVRTFPRKPEWIRFGIPARKSDLNRLTKALTAFNAL
ncbi:threonine-phosphate decarboxylase CobD [Pseudahrensia aquimaris]|uniref:threonine-phosphate decarboxylase n=1 Tax=Pseudahrensia aquimaris TaxID=744461 RepID=A0ABW3FIZ8_9HYPH